MVNGVMRTELTGKFNAERIAEQSYCENWSNRQISCKMHVLVSLFCDNFQLFVKRVRCCSEMAGTQMDVKVVQMLA